MEILIIKTKTFNHFKSLVNILKKYIINLEKPFANDNQIIGYTLLAYALRKKYKKLSKCYIEYNKYGKPNIKGIDDFKFNISHSGSYVVLGYSNHDVGIDVEKVKKNNTKIINRIFDEYEMNKIYKHKLKKIRDYLFYTIWTLKESYVKAIGMGLRYPFTKFSVVTEKGKYINRIDDYFFKRYFISLNYKLSVCSKNNNFPNKLNYISKKELFKTIKEIASNEH